MPDAARIVGDIVCPACRLKILDSARFQWGAVPGASYQVGDDVVWLRDDGGAIAPSFKLYSLPQGVWRWNCGDSQLEHVIVFDEDVYTKNHILACPHCHEVAAALVAIVRNGKIDAVTALSDKEVDQILGDDRDKANIVAVNEDGSYWPRVDWYDHPIAIIRPADCAGRI